MPDVRTAILTKNIFSMFLLGSCIFFLPNVVQSETSNSATLQWAANIESDLAGYRIYHGTSRGVYGVFQAVGKTTTYQYTNLEPSKTHYFTITAFDTAGNESLPSPEVSKTIVGSISQTVSNTSTASNTATVQPLSLPINATFETGSEGFNYLDDTFRGTTQPEYASGNVTDSGFSGQGLRVVLGGVDNTQVLGMSGGWRTTITLAVPTAVQISFRYNLIQTHPYEPDELSQVIVRVASLQPGSGGQDYVVQLAGGGTTGWQLFKASLGILPAGTHALTLGAYNNKKTATDETTEVLLDNVLFQKENAGTALSTSTPSNSQMEPSTHTANSNPTTTSTNVVWRNTSSGDVAVWLMNGLAISSVGFPGGSSTDWKIEQVGDMNGDGEEDVLWRNTISGVVVIWIMNDATIVSTVSLGGVSAEWLIKGIGDVNGDGEADVVWRNRITGVVAIWLINEAKLVSTGSLAGVSAEWLIKGIGDVNGDGKADVVWQNQTSGAVALWLMNGLTVTTLGVLGSTSRIGRFGRSVM